ncbi:hypothetical protein [Anaerocolumna chitinilytica]|uniref:Uncharacterized protein n=1 Tax=Anaerocolumna chitinilytica TaxID=1727145 RepID=A0A7I8DNF4_9FIRM|nr:hypothetical protein [Anaerocolumna chitinilytica]BCJ99237.1 hypothetical protein bsdcttw_22780 [Anaerocolumna chitinilytica]
MSHIDVRKQLLSAIYKTIFKEIYPISVGYAAHAANINNYSKKRKTYGYNYNDYAYLNFYIDDAADSPEFDFEVNEGNFHNWINGISSPKYLIIINSILEYIIECCKDKGKYSLLKDRILCILKSDEFTSYAGNLIRDNVDIWVLRIAEDDSNALFKATKELLYLLKNKDKFLPYLLKENTFLLHAKVTEAETTHKNSPRDIKDEPNSKKREFPKFLQMKYVHAVLSLLLILISYVFIFTHHHPESPDNLNSVLPTGVAAETSKILNGNDISENALTKTPSINNETHSPASSNHTTSDLSNQSKISISNLPSVKKTKAKKNNISSSSGTKEAKPLKPKITSPKTGGVLPLTDIKVQWKPVNSATSYSLVLTDTNNWKKIFKKTNIQGNSYLLKDSFFKPGGSYRIYIHSAVNDLYSVPAYIDINIEELPSPKITTSSATSLSLSDLDIQWEPVAIATGYCVVVTDTNSWTKIFTEENITDNSLLLNKTIFKAGGCYRIYVHSEKGDVQSAPSYIDILFKQLLPPEIIAPKTGTAMSLSDINVQWELNDSADSYTAVVTDTNSWTQIFSQSDIKDSNIILDKSLFQPGGSYRIYLHSVKDGAESVPNYIDITISK